MDAVLAAERAANHTMMACVTKQEQQSRRQHATLQAAAGQLESQSRSLQSQQAAIAHVAAAVSGPGGLQDRLASMQDALQQVVADLALIEKGTRARAAAAPAAARAPGDAMIVHLATPGQRGSVGL
ncbi:MAG: hypothetical protein ACRYHA_32165 [Janthinobacterium lividum]